MDQLTSLGCTTLYVLFMTRVSVSYISHISYCHQCVLNITMYNDHKHVILLCLTLLGMIMMLLLLLLLLFSCCCCCHFVCHAVLLCCCVVVLLCCCGFVGCSVAVELRMRVRWCCPMLPPRCPTVRLFFCAGHCCFYDSMIIVLFLLNPHLSYVYCVGIPGGNSLRCWKAVDFP